MTLPSAPALNATWPTVAEALRCRIRQASADEHDPWSVCWPTQEEMAKELGTTAQVVRRAARHLAEQGELKKARVPRPTGGMQHMWVPNIPAKNYRSIVTVQDIQAEVMSRGLSGEWPLVPTQLELERHFGVSSTKIGAAMRGLATKRMAVKIRKGGRNRWQIVRPHEALHIGPALTQPPFRVVTDDLIQRLYAGEFRYRLPDDDTIHERPFPSNDELKQHYKVSGHTIAKVRAKLVELGWIVPGGRNEPYRLAEHIQPVDRAEPPPPKPPRKRPGPVRGRRAHEVAADLINRILDGEFTTGMFPGLVETMARYNAGDVTVRAAFDKLRDEGWIEYRYVGANRFPVLADPLPDVTTRAAIQVWVYALTGTAAQHRTPPDPQERSLTIVNQHNVEPIIYRRLVALPRDLRRQEDIAHAVVDNVLYHQPCTLFVYLQQDGNPGTSGSVWLDYAPPAGTDFTATILPAR